MTYKIILLIALLAYSIVASQSFMYILTLKFSQMNLEATSYIELRKLVDTSMRARFTGVVYTALLSTLTLVIWNFRTPGSLVFITSLVAFVALVIDVILTLKGSLPINDVINSWSPDQYPTNWSEYRERWFNVFFYRQLANLTGFLSLLTGLVFGSR